jgi:hypothetical protein
MNKHTNVLQEARDLYRGACAFAQISYRQKDLAQVLELSPFKLSRLLSHDYTDAQVLERLNWFEGERLFEVSLSLHKQDYSAIGLV